MIFKKYSFALLFICLVFSLYSQKNTTFKGNLKYTVNLNDIWGYVDSLNNEYAIVGLKNGISIVDVTDPTTPIEKFFIKGPRSTWRDIKTWGKYAYVTHDATSGTDTSIGLQIINLSGLPTTIDTFRWTGDTLKYRISHNIFIDENGFAYLFGSNVNNGSTLILDLTDPENPVPAGYYSNKYVHDGFVRGDSLWTAEINNGTVTVTDISDKSNPIILASISTPNRTTHNCWVSDNGKYLFTTDEKRSAYITSYDVSDLSNIKELDRYRSDETSQVIPHNVFLLGDYAYISYYNDGLIILDVTRPENLIEVANYDTAPTKSGGGFHGAWGTYPYLPSGNILVSDIEEGLFIISSDLKRAAYLEGTITDINGNRLNNIQVELIGTGVVDYTNLVGDYKIGIVDSGSYELKISDLTCYANTVPEIILTPGQVTTRTDSVKCCYLTGYVADISNNELENVSIQIPDIGFSTETDINGYFTICDIIPGTYDIIFSNIACYNKTIGYTLSRTQIPSVLVELICESNIDNFDFFASPSLFSQNTFINFFLSTIPDDNTYISIIDVNGKIIEQHHINSSKGAIEIGQNFSSGIYFARLNTDYYKKTIKLVKINK